MRFTSLFFFVFSFCFIVIFCSVSFGQPEEPCGKPWNTPLSEVEGGIVSVYYASPPWTDQEGLHLEVETPSGIVVIHVFPKECTDKNPDAFQFEAGEIVTVTGSEFLTEADTRRNICAAEIIQRPDLKLRTLKTGCLNEELCMHCQGICEKQCASQPNPTICMDNCMAICEANITPCDESDLGWLPSVYLLLLLNNSE